MEKLIEFFGGIKQTASALNVSREYITMIKNGDRPMSARLAIVASEKTGGKFKASELYCK